MHETLPRLIHHGGLNLDRVRYLTAPGYFRSFEFQPVFYGLKTAAWRSGLREYWRIETQEGPRLWLFTTPQSGDWPGPGGAQSWHVQGEFA